MDRCGDRHIWQSDWQTLWLADWLTNTHIEKLTIISKNIATVLSSVGVHWLTDRQTDTWQTNGYTDWLTDGQTDTYLQKKFLRGTKPCDLVWFSVIATSHTNRTRTMHVLSSQSVILVLKSHKFSLHKWFSILKLHDLIPATICLLLYLVSSKAVLCLRQELPGVCTFLVSLFMCCIQCVLWCFSVDCSFWGAQRWKRQTCSTLFCAFPWMEQIVRMRH